MGRNTIAINTKYLISKYTYLKKELPAFCLIRRGRNHPPRPKGITSFLTVFGYEHQVILTIPHHVRLGLPFLHRLLLQLLQGLSLKENLYHRVSPRNGKTSWRSSGKTRGLIKSNQGTKNKLNVILHYGRSFW